MYLESNNNYKNILYRQQQEYPIGEVITRNKTRVNPSITQFRNTNNNLLSNSVLKQNIIEKGSTNCSMGVQRFSLEKRNMKYS